MSNRELALLINEVMKSISISDIFQMFIDAGWYSKKFEHMKLIAISPMKISGLGASGTWIQPGFLPNGFDLWIYPSEEIQDIVILATG